MSSGKKLSRKQMFKARANNARKGLTHSQFSIDQIDSNDNIRKFIRNIHRYGVFILENSNGNFFI